MISHHHKCIFVHVPKTAGQSIERIFLNLLGLDWETRAPLLLRPNDRPELGPPRLAHLKASEYVRCRYVPQDMFDAYFKFAFVRNPWSRMVSIYKYWGRDQQFDFKSFLLGEFHHRLRSEWNWFACAQSEYLYGENGELLVDYVGRFEDLQTGFNHVCEKLALPPTQLPHTNASAVGGASVESTYRDYYDSETQDYIAQFYARDIELFGYSFD